MVKRLSLTGTLLAVFVFAVTQMAPAADPKSKFVCRTYAVAELRTPADPVEKLDKSGNPEASAETQLIHFIERVVDPNSWTDMGGICTIEYCAKTQLLVVTQTPENHEQIAKVLSALRKFSDIQVALEIRFVYVTDETCQRLGLEFNQAQPGVVTHGIENGIERIGVDFEKKTEGTADADAKTIFINDKQLTQILKKAAADIKTNVMTAPKMRMPNGQAGVVNVGEGLGGDNPQSLHIRAVPAVSADRRFVKLRLNVEQTNVTNLETTVCIPDGGTVVFGGLKQEIPAPTPPCRRIPYVNRLFKTCPAAEQRTVLVMVTARIIGAQEEEENATAGMKLKPAGYLIHAPQFVPASSKEKALVELLKAYDEACDEGRGDEADKLARAALILDPTCFRNKD